MRSSAPKIWYNYPLSTQKVNLTVPFSAYESNTKCQPALVSSFRDKDNNITAVEAIYLDKITANKANFEVDKRTYGKKSGSATEVGRNTKSANNTTYIAEGLVTSLSMKNIRQNRNNNFLVSV